ncbi:hypothetical protein Back11_40820 [Paenibacillus baekrokdamisoli]|uniref:Uncharacterized protein n=1 Tax=Paenibacillus baekrokdamisoli TaxID=1712516 RepID=A0A3G9IV83_9BACL|nr:hypothetical protein [Paenibacillus baekrokdamisoli]MBB3068220.1 uncharacterized protein (DUF58 family) [Paenibacillus baekrokdamisoli]BBH22737.1 hypothetical protein Back11_40820 [Paenibacillus baekrokdamisoli]
MVNPWMTTFVIVFGIVVAIVGVIAYLRMYKNSAWSATRPEQNAPHSEEPFSPYEQLSAGVDPTDNDIK